jgi:Rps23 Pro-64 3,4-dihydroxylase Tpa1-like proline 4-hydroxylase
LTFAYSYKHGVIQPLIDEALLEDVRKEILDNLHFTPKQTDIYKIHQSGDLANLDGLDDSSLSRLPSLLKLRDTLYSSTFRHFISKVADSGPLSGKKTDMAINVYTPGCHLLCHDDVIGSRRLSYILYLTHPQKEWKPEYGGALRLYPTQRLTSADGTEAIVPSSEFSVSIPPQWNQLSFFTIQPGESFHDVEEVYERKPGEISDDDGRMRMAISGWFHIPQEGEDGYVEGLEEELAQNSSLTQLQNNLDEFDLPQPRWLEIKESGKNLDASGEWEAWELDWLLKYINPVYLTPDTTATLTEDFMDNSVVTLVKFLNKRFAERLNAYITGLDEKEKAVLPKHHASDNVSDSGIARPPHKHRFMYRNALAERPQHSNDDSPLDELLDQVFPSELFHRWLSLVTKAVTDRCQFVARRFRRGLDYSLATSYDGPPRLEISFGMTPSPGWGGEDDENEADDEEEAEGLPAKAPMPRRTEGQQDEDDAEGDEYDEDEDNEDDEDDEGDYEEDDNDGIEAHEDNNWTRPKVIATEALNGEDEDAAVGGYEVYMAGDDDNDEEEDLAPAESSTTGTGHRSKKVDPAVYKNSTADDEDDGVVFSQPASWNTLTIVLRDPGLLHFVKYVSAKAKGDRWDIAGTYNVVSVAEDDQNE